MVKTKKQLVASRKSTFSGTNGKRYITIHETANTDKGADAHRHANLQTNGFSASWHWQVDDKIAIQSFPHSVQCFHAGDGKGTGNLHSIGIEICVNSDGDFSKAVQNAVELVQMIMKQEGIPASRVVQHNHWSGKNCPANLRSGAKGISWAEFKARVEGKGVSKPSKPVEKPSNPKPSKPAPKPSTPSQKPSMASNYKGRRVESKVNGLRFYSKPSWSDKDVVGTVNKGYGFPTIMSRHKVGSSYQYKVKNSKGAVYYITAVSKYVKVVGATASKPAPSKPSKPATPKVGNKVTLKTSARFYATGEVIPARFKGKKYTIQQVKGSQVLLKELYSWVFVSDVS